MSADWLILHAGALGDLVLTLQLALRLPGADADGLQVISRTDPGDLSGCQPRIVRQSSETCGLHWLYRDDDAPPPTVLAELVRGRRVLSALGGAHTLAHQRLLELRPAAAYGLDPRPRSDVSRHIVAQWESQLAGQGLLIPRCTHQRPQRRGLGVPETLRANGREVLANIVRTWKRSTAPTAMMAPSPPERQRAPGGALPAALSAVCGAIAPELQVPNGPPIVVMHPGSGGRKKCWPLTHFIALVKRVCNHGAVAVALLGPAEIERWSAADRAALGAVAPVLESPNASELVGLLAGAAAYVGNDSGPTHLAALLGTPTVAVFVTTPAAVWQPLGHAVTVVTDAACEYTSVPAAPNRAVYRQEPEGR